MDWKTDWNIVRPTGVLYPYRLVSMDKGTQNVNMERKNINEVRHKLYDGKVLHTVRTEWQQPKLH